MRRLYPLFLLALLLLPAVHALGDGLNPVVTTLPNGLRVVVVENHAAPVVAVRFYVAAGSIWEGDLLGHGLSHYLEHTLGEGSQTRTAQQINDIVESIGNNSNAYTSTDHCCYFITTSTQYWKTALDVLGDYVFHASLPEKEAAIQKGVILRELAMDEDEPGRRIDQLFSETMFLVHPSRYPIGGFSDLFRQNTREQLYRYYSEWYVPDNVVLSIAGDVKTAEVVTACRAQLSSVPRRPPPVRPLPSEPPQTSPRDAVRTDERLQKAYLYVGYRTIPMLHPDLFPLDVLAYVLGHGASSRLNRLVREERQLVDSVDCASETPSYDAGAFYATATLDPDKVPAARAAILEQLERCRTAPVTREELERAKTQKEAELTYSRETAEGIAEGVGTDLLLTGDPRFSDRYVEGIRKVTAADIQRVAELYFRPEKLCTALLTPRAPQAAAAGAAGGEPPSQTVKKVLANGLTVLVQRAAGTPTVSIFAAAKGGVCYETAQNNGITRLMANMLVRGTKKRSREALARAVEDMGASLSPYSGSNSFGVSAGGLHRDLEPILDLVADVLTNADFPEAEVEAQKHFTLAALAGETDDVDTVARRFFLETMFTVSPYRFLPIGTEASVKSLTRQQLADYYARWCRPNRMVLSLFGDLDPETGLAAVEKALGRWPRGETKEPEIAVEPPLSKVKDARQQRREEQAIITIGFPGVTATDPRRDIIDVMSAVLCGRDYPGGRLHEALRSRQLVYYVFGRSEAGLAPGAFVIVAATQPEKVDEVIGLIRKIVGDLAATPVGDAELQRGKSMCAAEYDIGLASNAARASTATLDELYGLGHDRYRRYAANVERVTAAQVQQTARELLTLDRSVVTVLMPTAGPAPET